MTEAYVPDTLPTLNENTEATVSDPMQVDLPFYGLRCFRLYQNIKKLFKQKTFVL